MLREKLAHFMMELRIFNCVRNDDVEGLKLFMYYWNYPKIFQIEDRRGYTILQRAIKNKSIAVFDFLLSLDNCPINARNSKRKTALQVALIDSQFGKNEYFTYSLLKKGANTDCIGDTEILCVALKCAWIDVAKYLIEKGVELNCYCVSEYGDRTPLNMLRSMGIDYNVEVNELLAMMLCFGADPLFPDYQGYGEIDYAFSEDYLTAEMQEHIAFYVFDDYCTSYEITITNLIDLLKSDPAFAPQILKHVTAVDVNEDYTLFLLHWYFSDLFEIKSEYLKLLLEKFDYVVQNIIEACVERLDTSEAAEVFFFWRHTHIEHFLLLLQSQFSSDLIQLINQTRIIKFIIRSRSDELPCSELFGFILVVLSYGAILYDEDLEVIYETWGDCEFFRILLYMDIKTTRKNRKRHIMPGLLYDIHMGIETSLNEPQNYKWSENSVKHLLNYFAHPKLKNYCYSLQRGDINAKVKNLPSVPLLVELARNEVRKFLIRQYKIENSMQFYTLIKRLPISKIHQKIITLETKLY